MLVWAGLLMYALAEGKEPDSCDASNGDCSDSLRHHKYCVIGAGPGRYEKKMTVCLNRKSEQISTLIGGLQVGHLLLKRKQDYVIIDRNSSAGSRFEQHPVHRKLISINKRFSGRSDPEFNL